MTIDTLSYLKALSSRYSIERELGSGGIVPPCRF